MEIEDQDHELLANVLAKVVAAFLGNKEAIYVEWDDFRYLVYFDDNHLGVISAEDHENFQDLAKFKIVEVH